MYPCTHVHPGGGGAQGASCERSWDVGADAQVLDRGSMEQPCRFALRCGGEEVSLNASSLPDKTRLMRALGAAIGKVVE